MFYFETIWPIGKTVRVKPDLDIYSKWVYLWRVYLYLSTRVPSKTSYKAIQP